ncbi:HTH_Tnp_Tc3_2 domain-containing protein [Trichonephila clavipes]|nr:HTH_Tnp_Tc3_2 domain-containing protein [Trichonephila clavipes]
MLLDVSMCLVVLFSDFGINTNPKILCPEDLFQADHELQHLQRRPFSSSFVTKGRRTTTVPQLVADHFQASGRRISATTVRNRLHNAGLYARKTSCVRSPQRTTAKEPLMLGKENMFLGRSNNGLLCCSQTSPDLQWKLIQGVY